MRNQENDLILGVCLQIREHSVLRLAVKRGKRVVQNQVNIHNEGILHIGRFRNADAEPSILMPQRLIEPVTAAIADNSRIFGKTLAICVGKQHDKSS